MINCAFLVGCGEYDSPHINNLKNTDSDIRLMKEVLIDYCECVNENIVEISDNTRDQHEPTGAGILNAITEMSKKYHEGEIDNLIFYYTGHGMIMKEDACLMPKGCQLYPVVYGNLPIKEVYAALYELFDFKHAIFILDMCQDEVATKSILDSEIIITDYFPEGLICFYSCLPGANSYVIPDKYQVELGEGSVFTNVFANALKDENCYSVSEIDSYLKLHIKHYNSILNRVQSPFTRVRDISLGDVLLKKRIIDESTRSESTNKYDEKETGRDLIIPIAKRISKTFRSEYERANTIGVELEKEELIKLFDFVKYIESIDDVNLLSLGETTLSSIRKLNISNFKTADNSRSVEQEKFLASILKAQKNLMFRRTFKSRYLGKQKQINAMKSLFNKVIRELEDFRICLGYNLKNSNLLDEEIKTYIKELSMYIVASNIYINRNPLRKSTGFDRRIRLIEEYLVNAKELINTLNKKSRLSKEYYQKTDEYIKRMYNFQTTMQSFCFGDIWNNEDKSTVVTELHASLLFIINMISEYNNSILTIMTSS